MTVSKPVRERNCPGCGDKILATLDNGKTLLCYNTKCELYGREIPSETNEADYLKEFDELFGVSKDDDLITTTRYCLHNFLKSSIERARQDERQRVVEMLRKLKRTGQCTCMEDYSSCPYNIALSDVKEHLEFPSDKETI